MEKDKEVEELEKRAYPFLDTLAQLENEFNENSQDS